MNITMEKEREMTNEEEREQLVKQMGCMASFFHFFDRPHILSGSHRDRFSSSQSQMSGSVSPSERSEQSGPLVSPENDSIKLRPPSPEPDPTRSSLSVFKTASTWKLKEAPRLSLDSRLRPREIRTTTVDRVQEPDDQNRRSPSVVARLMGVDILPTASGPGSPAQLRRSNSESRVPRDSYRLMDSVPHIVSNNRRVLLSDHKVDPGPGPGSRVSNPHPFHKKSSFEPVDCFPEPTKRANSEITLYGEIERRLRKRGMIEEPSKDIETLKQVLEALQLKGLLHSQPLDQQSDGRRSFSDDHHHHLTPQLKPPIVLLRPGSKPPRSPKNESGFNSRAGSGPLLGPKRDRIGMDWMVRRSSSPDRGNEMVKSPSLPARRRNGGHIESPKSPQRRISPVRVRVMPEPRLAVRVGRGRREVEDDTSTSVSGSSVTASPLDFERSRSDENSKSGRSVLDRCDKLLNSIVAFTSTDQGDPQPSPVSVLDASILTEDSSPSPSSKRHLITPPKSPNLPISQPLFDFDLSEDELSTVGSESDEPDYFYIREFLHESSRYRDLSKAYDLLKKRHQSSPTKWRHRMLIYDAVKDILERKRLVSPWDSFTSCRKPRKQSLLNYVWLEIQKVRDPTVGSCEMVDLNEATCKAIEKDFAADQRWENPSVELSDAVLQIERLVFKDLIADTIQELADVAIYMVPRRKLVF